MSKFLKTLLTIILALSLTVFFVGCDETGNGDGDDTVTGNFIFDLQEDEDGNEYYAITGYTVNSEDALKMASGDFSSVAGKREITIPEIEKGKPVKEISAMAFADQIILTKVTVGENIEKIGEGAFVGCTSLEELSLPFIGATADGVGSARVLGHVFGSAATGDLNVSVTAKINIEEAEAATTFTVPASLKKVTVLADRIPECAFYGFSMLEEVNYPSAKIIGAGAFNGCLLLRDADLSNVEYIYDGAFSGCSALQNIKWTKKGENDAIVSSLKHIGAYAFASCSRIGYNFISDKVEDRTVVLPASVEYIGEYAFNGCGELKYMDISATQVTVVKTGTFGDCSALSKLTVKAGTQFKVASLSGCTSLIKDGKLDTDKIQGENVVFENGVTGSI